MHRRLLLALVFATGGLLGVVLPVLFPTPPRLMPAVISSTRAMRSI